jgi:hypothetical protein
MPVRFFYVDESYDRNLFCLSAISIRHSNWKECFSEIRNHRSQLKKTHGIFLRKELHANELVAGRGRIGDQQVGKWTRCRIFHSVLQLVARLPSVAVFNMMKNLPDAQMRAWDRLINRMERTEKERENRELPLRSDLSQKAASHGALELNEAASIGDRLNAYRARAFIIADEGREREITTALRRMHVHNPIPSRYGMWEQGYYTKNIVTDRIIEDPVFKPSHRSYFLQLADCVAYALLKRETEPTPHVKKYGIYQMFEAALAGVCFKKASQNDPLGIVRA